MTIQAASSTLRPESADSLPRSGARKTLTRLDLAEAVQSRVLVSRRQGIRLVQMVIDEIVDTLARGEGVKLSGFGAFQIRAKAERLGRNPKNGEPATIASRKVVVFRASRLLKAGLAQTDPDGCAPL